MILQEYKVNQITIGVKTLSNYKFKLIIFPFLPNFLSKGHS